MLLDSDRNSRSGHGTATTQRPARYSLEAQVLQDRQPPQRRAHVPRPAGPQPASPVARATAIAVKGTEGMMGGARSFAASEQSCP
jgi:hypothetical protein